MYKSDGNFIVKTLTPADGGVNIEFDEQMTAAPGVGFLDLKLTPPEGDIITCHARVMVDTPVYNDQVIESVSMVDGYIFPDDFQLKLTAGANITITEDNVISSTGGGGGGTGDYQDLINKPRINNVILSGNKTTAQLGLPTKTSDLTNDSGFITSAVNDLINYYKKAETYTKAEVNALLASLSSLNLEVVAVLPDHDISTTTIYLVPKDVPGTDDVYDEYVYINNSWEKIGSTAADLSNYYTKAQADALLSGKVDKVTGKGLSTNDFTNADVTKLNGIEAGAEVNVQPDWNQTNVDADDYIKNKPTIGVYTAGNGIDITNNRISVSTPLLNQISETAANLGQPATYDSTASYSVGDVCEYQGYAYKCNTAIVGGEAWDPDHWDATDAYNEIDTLNQNLAKLLYEKTYTNTSQTWQTVLNDFYSNIKDIISGMDVKDINRLKVVTGNTPCQVYNLMYVGSSAYHFIASIVNSNNISLYGMMIAQTNSLYVNSSLGSTISFGAYTGQAISSARTLQLYLA